MLKEIDKQAAKCDRTVACLLQIRIAKEETKFGFSFDECRELLEQGEWNLMKHVDLRGMMGMATYTDDKVEIRNEFHSLKTFFDEIKGTYFRDDDRFKEISMGMTHDYPLAIQEGSTLVRIGTKIFGERIYH